MTPSPLPVRNCRSCRAPILWATTENGKRIPLDAQPVEAFGPGLFVLREDVALAVPAGVFTNEPHYVSHFATCPNADEHRR